MLRFTSVDAQLNISFIVPRASASDEGVYLHRTLSLHGTRTGSQTHRRQRAIELSATLINSESQDNETDDEATGSETRPVSEWRGRCCKVGSWGGRLESCLRGGRGWWMVDGGWRMVGCGLR